MFPLYKKRNFGDYISDTFLFFRSNGKHFFKHFFIINGAFLLIAAVLIYFIFKVYFEFVFSSLSGGIVQEANSIDTLIENNFGAIVSIAILAGLFLIFISMIQFAFPVVYLDLYDKKEGPNFETKDIINELKRNAFKLIKFVIGSIFILFPILMIVMVVNILLCFIVIGFPLLLITIPAIMSWMHLTFYHYITGESRFFYAISAAFSDLKQQFWQIILSTMVMYVIIQIVMTIFTMIPYVFGLASIFTSVQNQDSANDNLGIATIMMTAMMVVSFIANYIINNLLLINEGLVYYSVREHNESISSTNSIDLIGSDSE